MSEEEKKLTKVNISELKLEELTLEEQEAFNYFNKSSEEVIFETNIDGEKFLEALGITKEEDFEKHRYRIITLLNLIEKQQKEIELKKNKVISKDKIRDKIKEIEEEGHWAYLKKGYWDYSENRYLQKTINILEELLEE